MSGKLMLDVSSRRGDVNLFFLVDVLTKLHHPKGYSSVHEVYIRNQDIHYMKEMEVDIFSTMVYIYVYIYICLYIYIYSLSRQKG